MSNNQPTIYVDVSAAIIKDGKVLLMLRPEHDRHYPLHWGIPGGGFEISDIDLESTAKREVFEEVGLEINNLRMVANNYMPASNNLFINFAADYAGGEIKIDPKEVAEAGWFGLDELSGKQFTPTTETLIRKLLA